MTQPQAAAWLALSVRQVKRLCKAVRELDCVGVSSRKRGVPSNRRIADCEREHFVALMASPIALRRCEAGWPASAGLWKPRRAKPQRIHSPRLRRAHAGELVQVDGSLHPWFEQRAPKCCLIAFIDDATGVVLAAGFFAVESTRAY